MHRKSNVLIFFNTYRATGSALGVARTSGVAGRTATNSYEHVGDFEYAKEVAVSELLNSCANAAFAQHLDVSPMAQDDGYSLLRHLHHEDTAGFALAQPCGAEDGC